MKLKERVVSVLVVSVFCCLFIASKVFLKVRDDPSRSKRVPTAPTVSQVGTVTGSDHDTPRTSITNAVRHNQSLLANSTSVSSVKTPVSIPSPWKTWFSWVHPDVLYPSGKFYSSDMDNILSALSSYKINKFDIGYKGTQLKTSMFLEGNQRTVFKPKRFSRDAVVDGPDNPYAGYDRHNGEIAAFHLDGILGFRLAPPVAGRRLNLTKVLSVTSDKLLQTYVKKDGNTCFYGKCYYCKPSDLACAEGDTMEGSVTLWLPDWYKLKTWRHPYQRTYIPGRKAKWEANDQYCQTLLSSESDYYHLLPDILDTAVFDYLIGNADRHHFETLASLGKNGRLLHIDSGKSFGNPSHDEQSILTPLKQCCRLRNSTWTTLLSFNKVPLSTVLDESLRRDKLYPILTPDHLQAIDRRLKFIIATVEQCIREHSIHTVLIDVWK